jgi:hypothetical protein
MGSQDALSIGQRVSSIDGTHEGIPAVWHEEVLWALTEVCPRAATACAGRRL